MSKGFVDKLKDIYRAHKDEENPSVPVKDIKEFLELSGVPLEEE